MAVSTAPVPYLLLPGTAREALTHWAAVFGGETQMVTYEQFGRTDGSAEAIAHGQLSGPVTLYASDAAPGETPFAAQGLMMSLLGTADPGTLRRWFDALADGGEVLDDLQVRPWGDSDGQVRDRLGVTWLIGHQNP